MFGARPVKAAEPLPLAAPAICPQPTFTFTQGVLFGQASMILLAILFIKFFVFEDSKSTSLKANRATVKARHRRNSSTQTTSVPDIAILKKLGYDLAVMPSESARWTNVLMGQIITAYRNLVMGSPEEEGGAKGFVEKAMNAKLAEEENPAYVALDHVDVKEVSFGSGYPVCSNMRVRPRDDTGSLRVDMDVDYSDNASISVDTRVLVNFPRPKFAILPVSLSLTIVKFSATLSIEIASDLLTGAPSLCVSLHPDFALELTSSSLIGARAKLQDIPKVEQLIAGRLRAFIIDKMVWPKKLAVKLPDVGQATKSVQEEFVLVDKDTAVYEDFGLQQQHAEADSDPVLDDLLGPARSRPARPPLETLSSFAAQPRISPFLSQNFDHFNRYIPTVDDNDIQEQLPGHLPTPSKHTSSRTASQEIRQRQRPPSLSQSMYSL